MKSNMWQQQRLRHETQLKVASWRPLVGVQRFELLPLAFLFRTVRWRKSDERTVLHLGAVRVLLIFHFHAEPTSCKKRELHSKALRLRPCQLPTGAEAAATVNAPVPRK